MNRDERKKKAIEFLKKEAEKFGKNSSEILIVLGQIALTPQQIIHEIESDTEIGRKHAEIIYQYLRACEKGVE